MRSAEEMELNASQTEVRGNGGRSTEELHEDIQRRRDNLDRTLSALERKLSPGELLDEALSYVKTGPGEMAANLGRTAKRNPMALALTGIGLAWLMFGRGESEERYSENRARSPEPPTQPPRQDFEPATAPSDTTIDLYAYYLSQGYPFEDDEVECILYDDLGADAASTYSSSRSGRGIGEKAAEWKDSASAAAAGAGETLSGWSEQASESAAEMKRQAQERMERIRTAMGEASDDIRERMSRARHSAWDKLERARYAASGQAHAVAERGRELASQTSDFIDRYPMSLIALGVAAGAALGTSLPTTRRENRLMGDTSESMKRQIRSQIREQADHAMEVAGAAGQAAMDEARAQGLSSEGMRAKAEELREKAERVAEAARDESERQGLTGEAVRDEVHEASEKLKRVAEAAREGAAGEHSDTSEGLKIGDRHEEPTAVPGTQESRNG